MIEEYGERVSAEVLKEKWYDPAAAGMIDDHGLGVRVVKIEGGGAFWCPLGEVRTSQSNS